jgi:smad nuclear-interacting protein 1
MAPSDSDYRDRRGTASRSPSAEIDRERRRKDRDDRYYSKKDHDDKRRRRSSRSPVRSDRDRDSDRRRERRRSGSIESNRRRHRSPPDEDSHRRRHRERDDKERHSTRRRSTSRSRSPTSRRRRRSVDRRSRSRSPRAPVRSRGPLPSQNDAFTSTDVSKTASPAPEKEKPNFANSGRLAAESNTVTVNGGTVVLKYHEPPEARKPPAKDDWRLYVFKGDDLLEVVPLGERSCWLIGREKLVVDFPVEHPSCSKQHAAIQFRYVEKRNEFGDRHGRVRPYLIDLESANGSMVNGDPIPTGRYVELRDKDVLKFGLSTREYVLMLAAD